MYKYLGENTLGGPNLVFEGDGFGLTFLLISAARLRPFDSAIFHRLRCRRAAIGIAAVRHSAGIHATDEWILLLLVYPKLF